MPKSFEWRGNTDELTTYRFYHDFTVCLKFNSSYIALAQFSKGSSKSKKKIESMKLLTDDEFHSIYVYTGCQAINRESASSTFQEKKWWKYVPYPAIYPDTSIVTRCQEDCKSVTVCVFAWPRKRAACAISWLSRYRLTHRPQVSKASIDIAATLAGYYELQQQFRFCTRANTSSTHNTLTRAEGI